MAAGVGQRRHAALRAARGDKPRDYVVPSRHLRNSALRGRPDPGLGGGRSRPADARASRPLPGDRYEQCSAIVAGWLPTFATNSVSECLQEIEDSGGTAYSWFTPVDCQ